MTADRADFGGRLRQAREARGISLAQIAASTKISTMALEALERNDASRLPGGLFSRAFVRAYAKEVGLDPEGTVEEFVSRFGDQLDGGDEPRRRGSVVNGTSASGSGMRWFGLFLTVVLIGVFFGVERYLAGREGGARAPSPATTTPASRPQTAAQTASPSTTAAAPGASGVAPGASAQASTGQTAQPPGTVGTGSPAVPVQTVGAGQKAPEPPAASLALRMVITTTAPCWVSAQVDGKRVPGRTVPLGEQFELAAAEAIVLTVGDAAALHYSINGAPGRPLGTSGQVLTVTISTANYQTYIQR